MSDKSRRATLSFYPYRCPSPESWRCESWMIQDPERPGMFSRLDDRLENWSSSQDIAVRFKACVNTAKIWKDCMLMRSPDAKLSIVVIVRCESTNYHLCGGRAELDHDKDAQEVTVDTQISGRDLADRITLTTELIVSDPGTDPSSLTPQLPCSRLLETDPHTVVLEGVGGQFPVRSVDFDQQAFLGSSRKHALWHLNIATDAFDEQMLGGNIQLWLNKSHPDYKHVGGTDPLHAITTIIGADVVAQMVNALAASDSEEVNEPEAFAPGTIGQVAWGLAEELYPEINTIAQLRSRVQDYPGLTNTRAQAYMRIIMCEPDRSEVAS